MQLLINLKNKFCRYTAHCCASHLKRPFITAYVLFAVVHVDSCMITTRSEDRLIYMLAKHFLAKKRKTKSCQRKTAATESAIPKK